MTREKARAAPLRRTSHGLSSKLLQFFEANPTEELCIADICAKWGYSRPAVSMAVKSLERDGLIEDKPRVIRKRDTTNMGFW